MNLCEAYKNYFSIGAAVRVEDLAGAHGELLKKHFNSLTCENVMKYEEIEPEEGRYDFDKADKIAEFAIQNCMKMRGHTFVWQHQTPEWVFLDKDGGPASRELLTERLRIHINTLVERYRGNVYAWDVVNEAIEDKTGKQLRETKWLEIIGEDYLKIAFELAREADKEAALYYNDYNNEQPEKLEKTINLLRKLKADGVPVDGVGIQGHWNIRDTALTDNLKRAIEAYAKLKLKIQVTELDISMFAFEDERRDISVATAEMIELQDKTYDNIFKIFRKYSDIITNVTFWGISDMFTWKDNFPVKNRKDWPLIFDENQQPKSAFFRIVNF